jgi:hypothetical protein
MLIGGDDDDDLERELDTPCARRPNLVLLTDPHSAAPRRRRRRHAWSSLRLAVARGIQARDARHAREVMPQVLHVRGVLQLAAPCADSSRPSMIGREGIRYSS